MQSSLKSEFLTLANGKVLKYLKVSRPHPPFLLPKLNHSLPRTPLAVQVNSGPFVPSSSHFQNRKSSGSREYDCCLRFRKTTWLVSRLKKN